MSATATTSLARSRSSASSRGSRSGSPLPGYPLAPVAGALLTDDPLAAVDGADAVYTDVWVSMSDDPETAEERRQRSRRTGWTTRCSTRAAPSAIALHCLPAHPGEEISAEVLYGERQRIWDQAENRRHAQKALLELLPAAVRSGWIGSADSIGRGGTMPAAKSSSSARKSSARSKSSPGARQAIERPGQRNRELGAAHEPSDQAPGAGDAHARAHPGDARRGGRARTGDPLGRRTSSSPSSSAAGASRPTTSWRRRALLPAVAEAARRPSSPPRWTGSCEAPDASAHGVGRPPDRRLRRAHGRARSRARSTA